MEKLTISKQTARRFIMGRQGLWPGRRWAGKDGTAQALRSIEALQMDPLNVIARSHDIALWGRVSAYQPEYLDQLLYQDRQFFDYGGGLFIYPIQELPYWHWHMQRCVQSKRWQTFISEHSKALDDVRTALQARGPSGNRDFEGNSRVNSYRGRKDTALAMFYLWLKGELFIHHREGFNRIYHFSNAILPPELLEPADEAAARQYFAEKSIAFVGLARETGWKNSIADYMQIKLSQAEAHQWLADLCETGQVMPVEIAGSKETWYALSQDRPLLETLEAGALPPPWQPLETTTSDEAVFLAPLEIVSARGRARWLFDFEYVWEVYKPAEQRRWGYYTLPILYTDRLVARFDPRLERKTKTLVINGIWLETPALADDPAFVAALGNGLERFTNFIGARQVNFSPVKPAELHSLLHNAIGARLDVQTVDL